MVFVKAGPQFGFKVGEDVSNETIKNFAKGPGLSVVAGPGLQAKGG